MKREEPKIQTFRLPFFQTVFGSYDILFSKIWSFAKLGGFFAAISTLLFFIGGQDILCFNNEYSANHFCTKNPLLYGLIHLLVFCFNFLFMQKWVQLITENKNFNWKKVFVPDYGTLKMIGLFLLYIFTLGISSLSFYLLYIRIPDPDWRIELAYFTAVSVGFIFPILGMRFFSYFAYVAQKQSLPSLKTVWTKTSGNMLQIIGSNLLLLVIALFLAQTVIQQISTAKPLVLHSLFVEYISQLFTLVVLSCFMNYCYIQKKLIEKDSEDGKG